MTEVVNRENARARRPADVAVEVQPHAGPVEPRRHLLDVRRLARAVQALHHHAPVARKARAGFCKLFDAAARQPIFRRKQGTFRLLKRQPTAHLPGDAFHEPEAIRRPHPRSRQRVQKMTPSAAFVETMVANGETDTSKDYV